MATFHTVWSVDLGKASLKAVKIRRERNNIEILAVDKIDYPVGLNGVDTVAQAREALNAFKQRNDVREPVVVAHPGQGTFSRFIKVPAFEAKKLNEMVGYEASQQIPFPLDEVIWDYHLVNRDYVSGEEREVGIFAVRREAIDDYLLDFTNQGLSVEVLSIGYLGLLNYIFFDLNPQEPSVVLDIGATHTDLILVDGRKFWIRALPHSGNDVNKAIMERFKLSFQEAEKLKIESAKAPQQAVKIFSTVIQPKLKELIGEVHRSIGYYRSQSGDVKFQHLYLLGNGSRIIGIKKYLSEQLGVQVNRIQSIRHFRVNRDVNLRLLQQELPAFGTAFGCALQGVGAGSCKVDLVPQEERIQKDLRRKRKHAFIALGIVYLVIILAGMILNSKIEKSRAELDSHKSYLEDEVYPYDPKNKKPARKARPGRGRRSNTAVTEEKKTPPYDEVMNRWVELDRVAEVRALALAGLRALGAVIPAEDGELLHSEDLKGAKDGAIQKAKALITDLNNKRLFIPWMEIKRIDWPEEEEGGRRGGRPAPRGQRQEPGVPAYKFSVFATVVRQPTETESSNLLRKLLVIPMEEALKKQLPDGTQLTIDTDVRDSSNFRQFSRIPDAMTEQERRDFAAFDRVRRRGQSSREEIAQDAGPFFGTEVSWYLRLRDPEKPEEPEKPEKDKR